MIVNGHITGWKKRTGSNARGEPARATQVLARTVPAACRALASGEAAELSAIGVTASQAAVYEPYRALMPDVQSGDWIELTVSGVASGKWFHVGRHVDAVRGRRTWRTLSLQEVDG